MIWKTAQVSWIDVLQILFYFGLVDWVCYASICNAGIGVWMLVILHVCCLSSEQPVCSYRNSNTDSQAHHKLTPIAVVSELSKRPIKPRKSWRQDSATRVTRTFCRNRFFVRNRGYTLWYSRDPKCMICVCNVGSSLEVWIFFIKRQDANLLCRKVERVLLLESVLFYCE
jgi:hypothetical protein